MTFGTMRRITAPTGTCSYQRPAKDWIRRSSASVMTQLKIAAIQFVFLKECYSPLRRGRVVARLGVCLVAVCFLALAGTIYAQQAERANPTVPNLDYAYSNLPTEPVGPDDLLALSVYDSPEPRAPCGWMPMAISGCPCSKIPFKCGVWFPPSWNRQLPKR